ncbi:MAG TPA: flagellar assembly protein FliW [Mycobacteriales bacterium]|nr:flagellar assembly protein FliW [Mycobacteriales bacterium]
MSTETDDLPIIQFVRPVPGFPEHFRYVLTRVADDGLLYVLRSLDDPSVRFLVIAPIPFFPDYAPEIDDDTLDLLDVHAADRLVVLLVVSAGTSAAEATVNLLAPIVVDRVSRRAAQVLLHEEFPLRAPLVAV